MKTQSYIRKPFAIQAVQLTAENFDEVVAWCNGTIETDERRSERYISVEVNLPSSEKQTKAYIGDWVLKSPNGFKVYYDRAFKKTFVLAGSSTTNIVMNIFNGDVMEEKPAEQDPEGNIFHNHGGESLQELRTVSPKDVISGKRQ